MPDAQSPTATYTTRPGDVLDRITWEYYGDRKGAFEHVLAANPGLAAHGSKLPGGLDIILPELPQPEDPNAYSLW